MNYSRLGNPPQDYAEWGGPEDAPLAKATRNALTRARSASPESSVKAVLGRPQLMLIS